MTIKDILFDGASQAIPTLIGVVIGWALSFVTYNYSVKKLSKWYAKNNTAGFISKRLLRIMTMSTENLPDQREAQLVAEFEFCRSLCRQEFGTDVELEDLLAQFHARVIFDEDIGVNTGLILSRIVSKINKMSGLQ